MSVTVHGYQPSVYTRIAKLTLTEKGVTYAYQEVNPFDESPPAEFLAISPFCRVPVLDHDGFVLYETAAISQYIDKTFDGPSLMPSDPHQAARAWQVMGMVDSYVYWPFVRQVFVQRVAHPIRGQDVDEADIAAGMEASAKALDALETIASGQDFFIGSDLSLADLHLVPMVDYFQRAPEGTAALARYTKLHAWWAAIRTRPSVGATNPLPQ